MSYDEQAAEEWRFAAAVIDRLLLVVFTIVTLAGNLYFLTDVPTNASVLQALAEAGAKDPFNRTLDPRLLAPHCYKTWSIPILVVGFCCEES